MIDILFIILSTFAIIGAFGMISFKQPSNSALSFIVTLIAISGLFALLNASFLFMIQIIVYAGAIVTLLLFIIMFLNVNELALPEEKDKFLIMMFGVVFLVPLNIVVFKAFQSLKSKPLEILSSDFGSIEKIGKHLFNNWVLPFELISILLTIALIGAIALAKKDKK